MTRTTLTKQTPSSNTQTNPKPIKQTTLCCLVLGDMGKGTDDQLVVAKSMKRLYKQYKPTFVVGLGDNIYPNGCESVDDPLFQTHFEEPYATLPNDTWYMCLGNHDYGYQQTRIGYKDNSQSQVDYTNHSEKWYMPRKYYSFTKGPVEFFYLDSNTDRITEKDLQLQLTVMKEKLDTSTKKFKVVIGHHTWRSVAGHGNASPTYETFLTTLFKDTKPTMYLCGHDHCKSVIVKDGITLGIIGTGGEPYYDESDESDSYANSPKPTLHTMHDCEIDYFSPSLGVGVLEISKVSLTLHFFNEKGFCEYSRVVR